SCQMSLRPEQFAQFAAWASEARGDLTIFAHGLSGDDLADHTRYVIWFGQSEALDMSVFD
ncbi:DOPA 4,5-dioxygenase family protein, partial [Erythrobacter sp.]|uniref:DOPA 4,5-dioxygenase family protein n=1 Tax=Erythrobacter sp. TaxID=1042 RepID=UPI00311FBC51